MATMILMFALVFLFGALLKSAEVALSRGNKVRELENRNENYGQSENNDEPLACDMLVTRVFEQRMVDAGIMEVIDMTTCENALSCRDCNPTFIARTLKRKQEILEEQKKKALEAQAKIDELNKGIQKRAKRGDLKLNIEHNGVKQTFDWPQQIPTYASVQVDKNNSHRHTVSVMFKWTANDGQQMGQRVMFPMLEWGGGFTGPKAVSGDRPRRPGTSGLSPARRKAAVEKLTKRLMAGMSRADAIAELRKNPPKPPKGKGAGSPPRGSENYMWIKQTGAPPRLVRRKRPNKGYS